MIDYNSSEYKRSRNAYTLQCMFQYFIHLLVADAFLSKLLTYLGISDSLNGIISSFISLSFAFQLLSLFMLKSKFSAKSLVIFSNTLANLFFVFLFLVPFIPVSADLKSALVVVSVMLGYAGYYLVYSIGYKWANSNVSPDKRGKFSAVKEMISLIGGMGFTAVVGAIVDRFEGLDNLEGAFLFIALTMFVLNIINFICYVLIRRDSKEERASENVPIREVMSATFGSKSFRSVIVLSILYKVAMYFTFGFMGVFKTRDLAMSVFAVQVINIVANFTRMAFSLPFGKYSDKNTYAKGFNLGMIVMAISFFINIFTTKQSLPLIIVHTVLFNLSLAGTGQNVFNITYSYIDAKYITQAMAIKESVAGLCGFLASLIGGYLLELVQKNGNSVFGINMYGQNLLSAISFIVCMITIVYTKLVIEKQKVMKQ